MFPVNVTRCVSLTSGIGYCIIFTSICIFFSAKIEAYCFATCLLHYSTAKVMSVVVLFANFICVFSFIGSGMGAFLGFH